VSPAAAVFRDSYLPLRDYRAVHGVERGARCDCSGCARRRASTAVGGRGGSPRAVRSWSCLLTRAFFFRFLPVFSCFSSPLRCATGRGGAGLRYDDLLNEYDPEVRETLRTMPPEEAELRAKRLTRAIDVDLKKTQLPDAIQATQDIWNPYIRARVGALKQAQLERQSE